MRLPARSRHHDHPSPVMTILVTVCAVFALIAWTRAMAGAMTAEAGRPVAPLPRRGSLQLSMPQPSQQLSPSLSVLSSGRASPGPGFLATPEDALEGPCILTRSTPRRPDEPRIAAAITTSRRPLLFRRAMLSFRTRCLDCLSRVDQWFAVDDGSSPEELAEMQDAVPGLTWIAKPAGERGHPTSLNAVLNATREFDYTVFLEDDFFFVKDEDFVTKALAVLDSNATIGQVVFNARYALTTTEHDKAELVGGDEVRDPTSGRVTHIIHEFAGPAGSPEWQAFFNRPGNGGKVANVHWPHFSLHSGVWRMAAMRTNGPFQLESGFEYVYGLRWMEKGFKTAFFPGVYSVHLGKPVNGAVKDDALDAMYAGYGLRHTANGTVSAYDLNGAIRRR